MAIRLFLEVNGPRGAPQRLSLLQSLPTQIMTLEAGAGLPFLAINYVKCFKCLFIVLTLSHVICETLVDNKREGIEDTLLEIMAMNIFWRSSRTVFLCKAVSEIHFASG